MKLSGQQLAQIHRALLAAFNESSLVQMVRFQLDRTLGEIAKGDNLSDTIFKLLEWAEKNDQVRRLIQGALVENPDNPELKALAVALATGFEKEVNQPQAASIRLDQIIEPSPSEPVRTLQSDIFIAYTAKLAYIEEENKLLQKVRESILLKDVPKAVETFEIFNGGVQNVENHQEFKRIKLLLEISSISSMDNEPLFQALESISEGSDLAKLVDIYPKETAIVLKHALKSFTEKTDKEKSLIEETFWSITYLLLKTDFSNVKLSDIFLSDMLEILGDLVKSGGLEQRNKLPVYPAELSYTLQATLKGEQYNLVYNRLPDKSPDAEEWLLFREEEAKGWFWHGHEWTKRGSLLTQLSDLIIVGDPGSGKTTMAMALGKYGLGSKNDSLSCYIQSPLTPERCNKLLMETILDSICNAASYLLMLSPDELSLLAEILVSGVGKNDSLSRIYETIKLIRRDKTRLSAEKLNLRCVKEPLLQLLAYYIKQSSDSMSAIERVWDNLFLACKLLKYSNIMIFIDAHKEQPDDNTEHFLQAIKHLRLQPKREISLKIFMSTQSEQNAQYIKFRSFVNSEPLVLSWKKDELSGLLEQRILATDEIQREKFLKLFELFKRRHKGNYKTPREALAEWKKYVDNK